MSQAFGTKVNDLHFCEKLSRSQLTDLSVQVPSLLHKLTTLYNVSLPPDTAARWWVHRASQVEAVFRNGLKYEAAHVRTRQYRCVMSNTS